MHVFDLIDKGRIRYSAAWLYVAFTYWHFTHTHTHPFNGHLSRTTCVSRYQKSKTNLDFTEAWDSDWQWHHLGHMQVCTSLQTDNHANTPTLSFFTGWMPFLPPNQQCQSTDILQFVIMCFGYVQTCKPVNSYTQIQIVFGRNTIIFFTFFDIGSIVLVLSTLTSLMLLPIVPVSYYNHTTPI